MFDTSTGRRFERIGPITDEAEIEAWKATFQDSAAVDTLIRSVFKLVSEKHGQAERLHEEAMQRVKKSHPDRVVVRTQVRGEGDELVLYAAFDGDAS